MSRSLKAPTEYKNGFVVKYSGIVALTVRAKESKNVSYVQHLVERDINLDWRDRMEGNWMMNEWKDNSKVVNC